MPTQRTAIRKTTPKSAKPVGAPRARAKSMSDADVRREIVALSERIDQGLALLEAETDRLMAKVLR
jgi:hypothetical protein